MSRIGWTALARHREGWRLSGIHVIHATSAEWCGNRAGGRIDCEIRAWPLYGRALHRETGRQGDAAAHGAR